jgi:hypothetical protein
MRNLRMTHRCEPCVHFAEEGISIRCYHPDNTYKNWLGVMFKKNPNERNHRGRCENYEETTDNESAGT